MSGFTIYMAVVMLVQIWRGLALVKCFDKVHRAQNSFVGPASLRYGTMFRMRVAMEPTMPWDHKDTELWTELVTQDRPAGGSHYDSCQGRPTLPPKAVGKDSPKQVFSQLMQIQA